MKNFRIAMPRVVSYYVEMHAEVTKSWLTSRGYIQQKLLDADIKSNLGY